MQHENNNNAEIKNVVRNHIVLKKMRLLKEVSRKEAGIIFNLSSKTIEKLENGRGLISEERLVSFAEGYGFSINDLMQIRIGQFGEDLTMKNRVKKEKDPNRKDRRFCTPNITKECKALKQLREKRGISQYELSRLCGFGKPRIGFYENGRRNLNDELISYIIGKMGYSMDDFKAQLEVDEMPYEIINDCNKLMGNLEAQTLKAVRNFLSGFTQTA